MPGKRYDPQTKSAIIEATLSARKAGKKWAEAFQAAKLAGFNGSQPSLEQMIRAASKKKSKAAARKSQAPNPPAKPVGLSEIEALVAKLVGERVGGILGRGIEILERAKAE